MEVVKHVWDMVSQILHRTKKKENTMGIDIVDGKGKKKIHIDDSDREKDTVIEDGKEVSYDEVAKKKEEEAAAKKAEDTEDDQKTEDE